MVNGSGSAQPRSAAERLRGFGPLGLVAIVVILAGGLLGPVVSAALVLVWARVSRTPLTALGFTAPRSWAVLLSMAVAFGTLFKLVMKALVMPLLGAPAINEHYHHLTGNTAALPGMVITILLGAGLGEEVFFRGYLFERLGERMGRGRAALAATVLLSTVVFALAHYPGQRWPGVEQAAVVGLVFGAIFARHRQLWFLIVAHAAFDLTALVLIYFGWESAVAHWLLR